MLQRMLVVALVAGLAVTGTVRAEDGPTGTWKWTVERMGQKRDVTLKLKLEGDKLTGSMPGRMNTEVKIEEATYKNGELSFTVTREAMGQKFVTKYTGKLEGDTIKGKIETERNGQKQSRDWEAKRSKD